MRHVGGRLGLWLAILVCVSAVGCGPRPERHGPWLVYPRAECLWPSGFATLDHTRAVLDAKTMVFRPAHPHLPREVWLYDAAEDTGWVYTPKERVKWRLVRFGKKQETLHELDPKMWVPRFRTADGRWWTLPSGRGKGRVFTFDGTRTKEYEIPGTDRIRLSPSGTVWAYVHHEKYFRYDRRWDRFVPGMPWDDFAFRVGRYELAIMPKQPDDGQVGLRRKVNGKWNPFMTPFGYRAAGNAYLLHGDRMLVWLPGCGVFEYDGAADRWVRLTDAREGYHPGFDRNGRRILAGHKETLVFDGDPFDYAPRADEKLAERVARTIRRAVTERNWYVRHDVPIPAMSLETRGALARRLAGMNLGWHGRLRVRSLLDRLEGEKAPLPDSLLKTFGLREKDNPRESQRRPATTDQVPRHHPAPTGVQ